MNQVIQEPTAAEQLAAVIAGNGTTRYIGTMRPILARIPETQLVDLDAMAKMSGKSRSAMVVHLLDVAIEEVRRVSTPAALKRIDAEALSALQVLQQFPEGAEQGEA